MIARYPLQEYIASFDFYHWLVRVQALGATEIVFDTKLVKTTKWPEPVVRKRFDTIIAPGPALAGLPSRIGTDGEPLVTPHGKDMVRWVCEGGQFKRLHTVKPHGEFQYTVTLRNDRRIPQRNSNAPAWRAFAEEIGAKVIEDYDDTPIHLHDRVALYAGADMNFGVPGGPLSLIQFTEYPVMLFVGKAGSGGMINMGIDPGGNCPWALPNQHIAWAEDNLDSLRAEFRKWKAAS